MYASTRLFYIAIAHSGSLTVLRRILDINKHAAAALHCFQCLGEQCEAGSCSAKATSDDMEAVCFRAEATDGFGANVFVCS